MKPTPHFIIFALATLLFSPSVFSQVCCPQRCCPQPCCQPIPTPCGCVAMPVVNNPCCFTPAPMVTTCGSNIGIMSQTTAFQFYNSPMTVPTDSSFVPTTGSPIMDPLPEPNLEPTRSGDLIPGRENGMGATSDIFIYEGGYDVTQFPNNKIKVFIRALEGMIQNLMTVEFDSSFRFAVNPIVGSNSNFDAVGGDGTWKVNISDVGDGSYKVEFEHPFGFGSGETETIEDELKQIDSNNFDQASNNIEGIPVDVARVWTSRKGNKVEGTVLGFQNGKVKFLRLADQKTFTNDITLFSDSDQVLIKKSIGQVSLASNQ